MNKPALVAACALVLAACAAAPAAAQPDTRPNIVVLMTDDQTLASMGAMPQTRSLLGSQGTTFGRVISTFPLCCPARATFLTGQYSHNHGVIHNAGPSGGYKVFDNANALPVWLQRAGYHTIHLGRYLNGYGETDVPAEVPAGWSDWHAAMDPTTFNYASWRMSDNGVASMYPQPGREGEHQTDFYGRRGAELIEGAAGAPQPFFLNIWFGAPHSGRPRDPDDPALATPSPAARHRDAFASAALPVPPSFDEPDVSDKPQLISERPRLAPEQAAAIQENYQQELESLQSVDDAVASIYGALQRSGELDNTLVVFTSDNGFMHGEHRWPSEKVLPYEESIRVPLVLRGPGVPRAQSDRRLVPNVDLAATLLDAADAFPGRTQDGRSLLPLLADGGRELGRDVLLENGQGANGVPAYRGLRTYRFSYIEHLTTGEFELYDLRRDPFQLRSVDSDLRYEPVLLELQGRLRRLSRCAGRSCRAKPSLRLGLTVRARRKRPSRPTADCVRGDLRVRVYGAESSKVVRADVYVGRRRVFRIGRPPFVRDVPHRRLGRGKRSLVRVRAELRDGRVTTLDRRFRACA